MKTPEEMAEEYRENHDECEFARDAFLAGYEAAQDQLLARFKSLLSSFAETSFNPNHTAWQMFDILNDQVADVSKVMCNTTMEEIKAVDTGEITPITNLPTSAKWISVKDRLPEDGQEVLVFEEGTISTNCYSYNRVLSFRWDLYPNGFNCNPSHWMPLPAPPKEEK